MDRRERSRTEDESPRESQPPGAPPSGGLLEAADRLLAAGDEAINRALSRDSEVFLAAVRQEGGQ